MSRLFSIIACACFLFSCGGKTNRNKDFIRVSSGNPRYFAYSDGRPYIPVGPNICWERFETDETKVLELYEQRFRKLSENGGNYTRIWLSAPFFEVEHVKPYEYDEAIARRIDKLLESADRYGIKIKFCFENFRKLTGQPAPFSTSVPFDKPIYSVENGGPLRSMEDYFNTEEGRSIYMSKINFFAERYADHPAVFGWELWNEINAVSIADKPQSILRWTADILPKVKSAFPDHLVMQSLGSYDRETASDMYRSFMTIAGNEAAQVHRYLDPGASWDICRAPMDTLASNAVCELLNMVADKPVVLSEVGAVEANHSGPSKLYDVDTLGILLHDLLFAPFFSGSGGPGQSWHWQFYIEKNDLWHHFGRFTEAVKGIDPIAENYRPFFLRTDDFRVYGLKGKTNTLAWCRDARSNWQTELIEQKAPEKRNVKLSFDQLKQTTDAKVRLYDPWENSWKDVQPENRSISVYLKRSVVIRLNQKTLDNK